jgi:tRNA pseudouridine38-40 synthase
MRYAIKFAYDGTQFSGSQRQPNVKTVEGEIIDCLVKHHALENLKDAKFQVASRTDVGVSALGNVLAITTNFQPKNLLNILNSKLPHCWFYGITEVDSKFNPRHAIMRWYRYHLYNDPKLSNLPNIKLYGKDKTGFSNSVPVEKIQEAATLFQGSHNFRNFAKPNLDNTERTIESITAITAGDWIYIDIRAKSFLWHQVRRLVNSWILYATGELTLKMLKDALNKPSTSHDFGVAPAESLFLMDIDYNINFEINKQLVKNIYKTVINNWLDINLKKRMFDYLIEKIV